MEPDSQEASPFFQLPAEIRYEIYRQLLIAAPPIQPYAQSPLQPTRTNQKTKHTTNPTVRAADMNVEILFACQRCRDEFLPFFFDSFTLCISDINDLPRIVREGWRGIRQCLKILHTEQLNHHDSSQQCIERQRRKDMWLDIEYTSIQKVLVLGYVIPDVLKQLQKLYVTFPALRKLTLRRVFWLSVYQSSENDTRRMTISNPVGFPQQPLPQVLPSSLDPCVDPQELEIQSPAERFSIWLNREGHRQYPYFSPPAAALSVHNLAQYGRLQELRKDISQYLFTQPPYRGSAWEQLTDQEKRLLKSGEGLKSISELDVVVEGEARLADKMCFDTALPHGCLIKDKDHLDTVIFEIDLGIQQYTRNSDFMPASSTHVVRHTFLYFQDPLYWIAPRTLKNVRVADISEKNLRLIQSPLMATAATGIRLMDHGF